MLSNVLTTIVAILGILASLGLVVGGVGFFWQKFRGGSTEAKAEVNKIIADNEEIKKFYKEQILDYQTIIGEQTKKINELTEKVGQLTGRLDTETSQKKEFLEILQGRDPGTKQFQEMMVKSMQHQAETNVEILRLLKDIYKMSKEEHDREIELTGTLHKK